MWVLYQLHKLSLEINVENTDIIFSKTYIHEMFLFKSEIII